MSRRLERLQDEIAVLEYRAGDVDALGGLIARRQARIYWYVLTMVQDRASAWDVSQDVWLAAISGLNRRSHIKDFAGWLYRIAHNKSISHLRKKRRLHKREEALPDNVAQRQRENRDLLCQAEDAKLVHECLRMLPLPQREVLSLLYLDDLSLDEIANILDVPRGTVRSRLHHGRAKMKELLVKKGYDHDGQ